MARTFAIRIAINFDGSESASVREAMRKIADEAKKTSGAIGGIERSAGAAAKAMSTFGSLIAGAAIQQAVSQLMAARTQMDSLTSALRVAAGEGGNWRAQYQFVANLSKELGLDLRTAGQSFASLAVAARGTALEGAGAQKIFAAVAKATVAMGLSADQAQGALLAVQQMISKGKVSAEELRGQLGERLPGAFGLAAQAMGVTTAELDKMLTSGQLTAEELLPKLAEELEKAFGAEAQNMAKGLQAEMNRLSTAWFELQDRATSSRGFADAVGQAAKAVQWLADNFGKVRAFAALAQAAVVDGFGYVVSAVSGFFAKLLDLQARAAEFFGRDEFAARSRAMADSFREAGEYLPELADALREVADEQIELDMELERAGKQSAPAATGGLRDLGNAATEADPKIAKLTARIAELRTNLFGAQLGQDLPGFGAIDTSFPELGIPDFELTEEQLDGLTDQMNDFRDANEDAAQRSREAWLTTGDFLIDMLSRVDEKWAQMAAQAIAGAQQVAQAWAAAQQATGAGEGAMAGAAMGQGVYNMGQGLGLWDAGRGQGQFGGQLSGNYADVGSTVGGIIGGIVGSFIPVIGTALGSVIGSVLGGVIGSAIKSGADEGLASLRMVGDEVQTRITKDEGGLGKMLGGIGSTIAESLQRILSVTGGELEKLADLDLKIRDDKIIVFVNGLRRVFNEVQDAVSFALAELLRTAEISGLSANQQAVLANARNQGAGNVGIEELASNFEFANIIDRLGLGEVGQSLAQLGDWFRVTIDRAVELGFTAESLAQIIATLDQGFADARRAITDELDILAGISTEAGRAVAAYAERVREALRGATEYNDAAAEEARSRAARVQGLRDEIAAQQAAMAAARARLAEMEAEGLGPMEPATPGGPRDQSPEGGDRVGDEVEPAILAWAELMNQIRDSERSIASMTEELALLAQMSDQSTIDVAGYTTKIIAESRNLFRDFTDQFTAGPATMFARQIEQFGDHREAAGDLLKQNLKIAETEEQRALAMEIFRQQLVDLAEAEEAFRTTTAQETLLSIADSLGQALGDQLLLGEAERLRHAMTVANYYAQLEVLRATGKVSAEMLAYIEGAINEFASLDPAQLGRPRGGGGGRRDARNRLGEELDDAIRGPLDGLSGQLDDLAEKSRRWAEEARKLGLDLDKVREATEAERKRIAEDAKRQIDEMLRPSSSAGRQVLDLKKWRDDFLKNAAALGLSLDQINAAFQAGMKRIIAEVRRDFASYTDVLGARGLRFALLDNAAQADALRANILALGLTARETDAMLRQVEEAEKARAAILRQQARADLFEGIAGLMEDGLQKEQFLRQAAEIRYQLEVAGHRAQLEFLYASNALSTEAYNRLKAAIEGLPDLPPGLRGDGAAATPLNRGEFARTLRGVFDPTGGTRNAFRDLDDQFRQLRQQLIAAQLPTEEYTRLLGMLAANTEAARQQLAMQATADLFEGVARYMQDGAEKEEFLRQAAEIRYDMEMATMSARLEFLRAEGEIAEATYNQIRGALDALPDDLPEWMQGGGGGGYNGPVFPGYGDDAGGPGGTIVDRLKALRDAMADLAGRGQITTVAEQLAQMRARFDELRPEAEFLGVLGELQSAYGEGLSRFLNGLMDPIREFNRSLLLDPQLSTLTPFERMQEQIAQFDEIAAAAAGGDLAALQQFPEMARALAEMGRGFFASGSDYESILDRIYAAESLIGDGLLSAAQASTAGSGVSVNFSPLTDTYDRHAEVAHADARVTHERLASLEAVLGSIYSELRQQRSAGTR